MKTELWNKHSNTTPQGVIAGKIKWFVYFFHRIIHKWRKFPIFAIERHKFLSQQGNIQMWQSSPILLSDTKTSIKFSHIKTRTIKKHTDTHFTNIIFSTEKGNTLWNEGPFSFVSCIWQIPYSKYVSLHSVGVAIAESRNLW